MKRVRGMSLIELLVTVAILAILSSIAFQGFLSLGSAQKTATNLPPVQEDALRLVTIIADDVKDAVLCTATSGCTTDSAVHSAAANSMVVYVAAAGTQRTFKLTGTEFQRLEGSSTTPSLSIPDVTALVFKYYTITGATYNSTSNPTTWSNSVTGATLKEIAGVRVTATITRGGLTSTQTTDIRLRNSPKKVL